MSIDPRAQYDAVAAELAATSPTILGKMFGMPCLKTNGRRLPGSIRMLWFSSFLFRSTRRRWRSPALGCLIRQVAAVQ